ILLYCQPAAPEKLWNNYKSGLCEDITRYQRGLARNSQHDDIDNIVDQKGLDQLNQDLLLNGKSLKDFPNIRLLLENMPEISNNYDDLDHLIQEEKSYNNILLEKIILNDVPLLNADQRTIYNTVIQSDENNASECFFIDGPGGTGKTFLYNTILAKVRSHGEIALPVASSGIAALLIDGGRTAHSRLKIPIKLNETSTCNISRGSKEAHLISMTKLFIWDELQWCINLHLKLLIEHFVILHKWISHLEGKFLFLE